MSNAAHLSFCSRSAFTLIELLVVIVLIAILTTFVLSDYQKFIEYANATEDLSNLRQLGIATNLYLNDNGYLMGQTWPDDLTPAYAPNWKVFHSPFDKRSSNENSDDPPVSYDFNCSLWGKRAGQIVSLSNCILFAPLTADASTLQFISTEYQPGLPAPLSIESNGEGSTGGTHLNRSQITVIFCDLHTVSMPMLTFHSQMPNPDSSSSVRDIRWNR